jgi:LmbE family N-acetylglucosaminyl deacetylase
MKYLVIVAHPDDEVLGCGGSMAKWSNDGFEVNVLIMAEGSTSRDKVRDRDTRQDELSRLAQSAGEASKILGTQSVKLLDYPDNRMDSLDLLDVVKTIEDYIEKLQPEVVITHHLGDLNIDHQIIHQAVMTACRPVPGQSVKCILAFEIPSATEWNSPTCDNAFMPTWFEDITDTLTLKSKALKAYEPEMREWPHARSIDAVKHLARWRGASVSFEAAEAFMLIRKIK